MGVGGFLVQQKSHRSHNLLPKISSFTGCGLHWENDSDLYSMRTCWDVVGWEMKLEPEQKVKDQSWGAPAYLSGLRWRPWLHLLFNQDAKRHHYESVDRKTVFTMQEHTLMQAICLSLDFQEWSSHIRKQQQGPVECRESPDAVSPGPPWYTHCLLLITIAESKAAETCT